MTVNRAVRLQRQPCQPHEPPTRPAEALGVQEDRLRGILSRWRHASWAETGALDKGPAWCWLTPAGMRLLGLS
ncbi:MAG TPA: hypothetical protein VH089_06020 [Streptosporangiaceae bacterium]|nr:hypothetical protein [Streptosporangiaceae bacterium]